MQLLKLADGVVGRIAVRLLPRAGRCSIETAPRSVLFIRPGGIGDAVLLVPALLALLDAFPACNIDVLAEKRNAQVFSLVPGIRKVWCYDAWNGLTSAIAGNYDVVVDSEQSYRLSAVVARLCRASLRIGFGGNGRGRLFSEAVSYRQELHEAQSFLSLLTPLQLGAPRIEIPFIRIPPDTVAQGERLLLPLGEHPFVCLFPGASVPEKQWGVANFKELASALNNLGFAVVVVGGRGEVAAGGEIVAGINGLNLAGRSSLAVSAALLSKGAALVSGDSGVLHLAYGLGVPTVSLFGPSNPVKWAPKGLQHICISSGAPCSPCSRFGTTPPCPISVRCLSELGVAEVLAAVKQIVAADVQKMRAGPCFTTSI